MLARVREGLGIVSACFALGSGACGDDGEGSSPGAGGGGQGASGIGADGSGASGAGATGASGGAGGDAGSGNTAGAGASGGGGPATSGSLRFVQNAAGEHEYARHTAIPGDFGAAELTLEVWITLENKPVGSCAGGADQLTNWCDADNAPYSSSDWWYTGNFLLDGHHNGDFSAGTFSLQHYGGGRIRWELGDGASPGPGGIWAVQAFPATETPSLLDEQPHLVAAVRRFSGSASSDLELWVDGALVATETSPVRTNLRDYWDGWPGFPPGQSGWFWGAEKQAAIGSLSQYEDFKGLVHEVRFWNVARSAAELASSPGESLTGTEPGLVGWFDFTEGSGDTTCDSITPGTCMTLSNATASIWGP